MPSKIYRPNGEKVAAEIIENDAIIINVATGTYYSTEGIGGWVWERCVAGNDTAEIGTMGCARFDVSAEQLAADMQIFLDALKAEELVHEVPATSSSQVSSMPEAEGRLPYVAPKLVAYRDLKDLLALDPPMPRLDLELDRSRESTEA